MKYSIEKTEQYALLHIDANELTADSILELGNQLKKLFQETDYMYYILNLQQIATYTHSPFSMLQEIQMHLAEKNGLLLCIHESPDWMQQFEANDLLLVPTENEAIEYVFMDQLEKQFLDDDQE